MANKNIKKLLLKKAGDNFVADIENIENRISQNSSNLETAKQELSNEVKNVDNQLSKLTYNIKYGNKSFRSALIFYAYPTDINQLYEVDLVVPVIGQYDLAVFGRDLSEPTCEARPDAIKIITKLNESYGTEVFGYVPIGCLTPEEDPEIDLSNLTIAEIKTRVLSWKEMGAKGIFLDEFGYDFRTTRERQNEIVDFCHENSLQVIANGWVLDHVFGTENYIVEAGNTAEHPGNPNKLECHLTENDYIFFENLMFEATSTTNVKAAVPWDVYKVQEYYEKYYKKFKTQVFIANQIPSKASVDVQKELKRCSEIAGAVMQADVVAVSAEFWSSDTPKTFYAEPFEIDGVKSRFIAVTESKATSGYPVKFKSVIGSKEYELVWNASKESDTVYSSAKNYAQVNSNRNYPLNVSAEKLVYQDYEITAKHNFKNGINLNGVTLNGKADGSLTWNSKEISTKEYVDTLLVERATKAVPAGTIIPFAGASIPDKFLLCNGSAVSRTEYADLFAVIGTAFGAGDGSSTFTLPDLRDRVIQGASATHTLAQYIGAGLPNITGSFIPSICTSSGGTAARTGIADAPLGAFSRTDVAETVFPSIQGNIANMLTTVTFNASSSNAIYGKSSTVQMNSLCLNYIIKI